MVDKRTLTSALFLLVFCLTILVFSPLSGQPGGAIEKKPYRDMEKIAKKLTGCRDIRGRRVTSLRDDGLYDVAVSDLNRYVGPIIILNHNLLAKLKPASQRFFYMHECGHHALGHVLVYRFKAISEQDADCYALRRLIYEFGFTFDDIRDVQSDLVKFGVKTKRHLPGEERARTLIKCMKASKPQSYAFDLNEFLKGK